MSEAAQDRSSSDVYARYAQWRQMPSAHFDAALGCFLVTRYRDVLEIVRNHHDFSSRRTIALGKSAITDGLQAVLMSDDPPRHTRIRNLVSRWFTSSAIAPLRPWVRNVAQRLIEGLGGQGDAIASLAVPLPVMTIAQLLGVDCDDWQKLKHWSSLASGLNTCDAALARREMISLHGYFGAAIRKRRDAPMDDLISRLIEQNRTEQCLREIDLRAFCVLLLGAGNETTTNLLGNVLASLAGQPQLWTDLRYGTIPIAAVVEESMRYDSPVQIASRVVVHDVQTGAGAFAQGDAVALCLGAANRDPAEFERADVFDPRRADARHIAFGHGIHFCLGSALARMETEVVLAELLSRFTQIRTISAGERIQSAFVRGFASLPMAFEV